MTNESGMDRISSDLRQQLWSSAGTSARPHPPKPNGSASPPERRLPSTSGRATPPGTGPCGSWCRSSERHA